VAAATAFAGSVIGRSGQVDDQRSDGRSIPARPSSSQPNRFARHQTDSLEKILIYLLGKYLDLLS
jgi:hypothetical protein